MLSRQSTFKWNPLSANVLRPMTEEHSKQAAPRYPALVRVTHWSTTLALFCLLWTGCEIVISHPRFYWGEAGNTLTPALFQLPIPSSRAIVITGYSFVLKDQNGWSRALHFQAGWLLVLSGFLYILAGVLNGHLRKNVLPGRSHCFRKELAAAFREHLHFTRLRRSELCVYNVLQRITYALVILVLFPLAIWTGLAMSPGLTARFPFLVSSLGGHQSARTIHLFSALALTLFVVVHVAMVSLAGFKRHVWAMITGRPPASELQ